MTDFESQTENAAEPRPEPDFLPNAFAGPAWNISSEYPSLASNEFVHDLAQLDHLIQTMTAHAAAMKPAIANADRGSSYNSNQDRLITDLQAFSELETQAHTLLGNLTTFVKCEVDLDGTDGEAIRMAALLAEKRASLMTAVAGPRLFLDRATEEFIQRFLLHEHTADEEFALRQSRTLKDTRLTENEQTLLEQLRPHGFEAWSNLYNQIASSLRCRIENPDGSTKTVGLAHAAALVRGPSETQRRVAWNAIQNAWRPHEISCAAALNGLAGWRLATARRRSHSRALNSMDLSLHEARMKEETLEAMMQAVSGARGLGQRAVRALARGLGKRRLDPWDLLAPAPTARPSRTFKEGLALIRDAFAAVDPTLADFVDTMDKNRWIEGRILPSKQQGAYCTRFAKSRTPRVFQTYTGTGADIRVLAHELGHAYHAWIMRDLPLVLHRYPMTLAETASLFAETALAEHLAGCGDPNTEFEMAWQDAASAASYLLNIPARYDFERCFYERRQTTAVVSADELSDMTEAAWRKWYGDSLSSTERQFWMTKLHFSMSNVSFYNYPYTFGYVFSLAVYARKSILRAGFLPMYTQLLRDTGRLSSEELANRHLNEDITQVDFWKESLKIVENQIVRLEKLLPPLDH